MKRLQQLKLGLLILLKCTASTENSHHIRYFVPFLVGRIVLNSENETFRNKRMRVVFCVQCYFISIIQNYSAQKTKLFHQQQCKVIKISNIFLFQNDGGCCWIVYQKIRFGGNRKILALGESWIPTFKPKSISTAKC